MNGIKGLNMIKFLGQQAVQLAMVKDTHYKLKDKWCEEQQKDLDKFFEITEGLVENAINSNQSPLSYQILQQAKADFVKEVLETWCKYRLVEFPKDYRTEMLVIKQPRPAHK
jgi:hypothetical protein